MCFKFRSLPQSLLFGGDEEFYGFSYNENVWIVFLVHLRLLETYIKHNFSGFSDLFSYVRFPFCNPPYIVRRDHGRNNASHELFYKRVKKCYKYSREVLASGGYGHLFFPRFIFRCEILCFIPKMFLFMIWIVKNSKGNHRMPPKSMYTSKITSTLSKTLCTTFENRIIKIPIRSRIKFLTHRLWIVRSISGEINWIAPTVYKIRTRETLVTYTAITTDG